MTIEGKNKFDVIWHDSGVIARPVPEVRTPPAQAARPFAKIGGKWDGEMLGFWFTWSSREPYQNLSTRVSQAIESLP